MILRRLWLNSFISVQHSNGTLYNYIDQDTSFADSSSTALLAAASYRLASITGSWDHITAASKAFDLIKASLTDDGWLLNTVDPLTFSTASPPGTYSPEGQAFVLLLQAAWRDFAKSPLTKVWCSLISVPGVSSNGNATSVC